MKGENSLIDFQKACDLKKQHKLKTMNVTKVTFSDRFSLPTPFSPFFIPGGAVWQCDDLFPLIILASFWGLSLSHLTAVISADNKCQVIG